MGGVTPPPQAVESTRVRTWSSSLPTSSLWPEVAGRGLHGGGALGSSSCFQAGPDLAQCGSCFPPSSWGSASCLGLVPGREGEDGEERKRGSSFPTWSDRSPSLEHSRILLGRTP